MRLTPVQFAVSLLLGLACLLAGCLQIETRVALNPDGSATVTERVRFSQQLLSLAQGGAATQPDAGLASLLEKKAVLARMSRMGKGVELVSHEVRDAAGGRESLAVFKVADLNDFEYASPFLAYVDYPANATMRCKCQPLYKSRSYAGSAGQMSVMFYLTKSPRGEERPKEGEKLPPGPSPAQVQIMRELGPVFRDVMSDFQLRFSFESYAPIEECGFGYRGAREKSRVVDLLDFSADDLDKFSIPFLQNEEVMLDLVRGKVGSDNVVANCTGYWDNPTIPVFLPWGSMFAYWHQGDDICFRPSRQLFDRYFAKDPKSEGAPAMLDYSRWAPNPPDKLVPADFAKIGWTPNERTNK